MHSIPHPRSGQYFQVQLMSAEPQAVYDQNLNGTLIRLVDWADRIEQYPDFTRRQIELAAMFYAHRHLPDHEISDGVPLHSIDLDGLVIGTRTIEDKGRKIVDLVVLKESELLGDAEAV